MSATFTPILLIKEVRLQVTKVGGSVWSMTLTLYNSTGLDYAFSTGMISSPGEQRHPFLFMCKAQVYSISLVLKCHGRGN